ncbi:acyl-CoA-binding domain 3 [Striga asiatica]|uniref:Acyl-CoA-binding domain 3 n=1 Tax=Striga asiatica TaxID=4170 RepID=A0A5A7PLU0_STRAF|nr:acyl-CoA-binding domain 3 [Striga asiatica]
MDIHLARKLIVAVEKINIIRKKLGNSETNLGKLDEDFIPRSYRRPPVEPTLAGARVALGLERQFVEIVERVVVQIAQNLRHGADRFVVVAEAASQATRHAGISSSSSAAAARLHPRGDVVPGVRRVQEGVGEDYDGEERPVGGGGVRVGVDRPPAEIEIGGVPADLGGQRIFVRGGGGNWRERVPYDMNLISSSKRNVQMINDNIEHMHNLMESVRIYKVDGGI